MCEKLWFLLGVSLTFWVSGTLVISSPFDISRFLITFPVDIGDVGREEILGFVVGILEELGKQRFGKRI